MVLFKAQGLAFVMFVKDNTAPQTTQGHGSELWLLHIMFQLFYVPNKKKSADGGLFWESQNAMASLKVAHHILRQELAFDNT